MADRWKGIRDGERVKLDLPGRPLPLVLADIGRIERVFSNLISNALEYSDGEVLLRAEQQGSNVVVSVTDQGRGISGHEQKRIFERFYRASNFEGRDKLGLGLYISRLRV